MNNTVRACFVTGTDTGVGKTTVAAALLYQVREAGGRTVGLKPVASGCVETEQGLRNDDALALMAHTHPALSYEQINPVALQPAIAPHIAAEQAGRRIMVSRLEGICRAALMSRPDFALVEGAGGWRVPLNAREQFSDLAVTLGLPVILVVGLRLGCINHALLTAGAIRADGLPLAGWVANQLEAEMPVREQNLRTLAEHIPAPCLGEIPLLNQPSPAVVAQYLSLP